MAIVISAIVLWVVMMLGYYLGYYLGYGDGKHAGYCLRCKEEEQDNG